MTEPRTEKIGECVVTIGPSWVVTRFPDGTEVHAHPTYDDESLHRALGLGYTWPYPAGDHIAINAMCRDHDYLHSVVAAELGLPWSPTLWAVAHGEPVGPIGDYEERVVLARQKAQNER
jgi:hypothetical protein